MRSTSRLLFPLFLAGAVLTALLTTPPAHAGLGVWTSTGPEGTWFRTIVIDPHAPSVLYAGLERQPLLLKSLDAGETWTPAARGIASDTVKSLAADPVHPGVLYAGTNHGVFKSTDGAATWLPLQDIFGDGTFDRIVYVLAVDPARPSHVYAGTGSGFFRSTDGGSAWTKVNEREVFAVAFDPFDPSNILVTLREVGVLRSRDGGTTFVPAAGDTDYMFCVAFDPLSAGTALATSWDGVYRSRDGGGTWQKIGGTVPLGNRLAAAPGPTGMVWYAGFSSVLKSVDGGATWNPSGTGLPPMGLQDLAVDATSPSTLYAVGTSGAYRSTDGGTSWRSINRGLPYSFVWALAIDPVNPQVLYAGLYLAGLVKSEDGGRTWRPINRGLTVDFIMALAVDPSDPSVVWAGNHRSTDGGETWELRAGSNTWEHLASSVAALAIDPRRTSIVWAGTFEGLFKTTDSGATWRRVHIGLFQGEPGVSRILIDPLRGTVYADTDEGIVRSRDGGASWELCAALLEKTLLALDPRKPNVLYASSSGGSIFRSPDGGDSWSFLSSVPPTHVERLLIDPRDSAVMYAAPRAGGVLRSSDGGVHWSFFNEGLSNLFVLALQFAPGDPATLHAATYGGGVFNLTLVSSPPAGEWLTTDAMPGFRVKARLTSAGAAPPLAGRKEARCLPETLCISGALPGRPEVFLRVIGPRPNGFLWVQIVRFTPSQVEVWVEQESTGAARSYVLEAVPRDGDELPGLIDRTAFRP